MPLLAGHESGHSRGEAASPAMGSRVTSDDDTVNKGASLPPWPVFSRSMLVILSPRGMFLQPEHSTAALFPLEPRAISTGKPVGSEALRRPTISLQIQAPDSGEVGGASRWSGASSRSSMAARQMAGLPARWHHRRFLRLFPVSPDATHPTMQERKHVPRKVNAMVGVSEKKNHQTTTKKRMVRVAKKECRTRGLYR